MKLELLKTALEHYVLSADCSEDNRKNVFEAIAECNELIERYESRDIWKDTVYLVSSESLSDLLNLATYDEYGKLARIHNGNVPFPYYADKVRKWQHTDLTNRSLELGYDIVSNLWHDNEEQGKNKPDGTFDYMDR